MTDTDLTTIDAQTGEVITSLTLREVPSETLAAAHRAAAALQDVIAKKKKPVIFNGEQYLEFEDWQTVGRFYGVTAKVERVDETMVSTVRGFKAVAVAQLADGRALSRAEAFCMADEPNWRGKPVFQLASMAQTRACAKALRNVLAWVVVLAGYRGTPAEELPRDEAPPPLTVKSHGWTRPPTPDTRLDVTATSGGKATVETTVRPGVATVPSGGTDVRLISDKQLARLKAIAKEAGWTDTQRAQVLRKVGVDQASLLRRTEYDAVIDVLKAGPDEDVPF